MEVEDSIAKEAIDLIISRSLGQKAGITSGSASTVSYNWTTTNGGGGSSTAKSAAIPSGKKQYACSKCGTPGHRAKTCPVKKKYKKRK